MFENPYGTADRIRQHLIKGGASAGATVDNFTFRIESGEFIVLLGQSGCGKTTLLRLISGLEKPDTGNIYIGEKNVTWMPPKDREVAMVFQNYALYPHLTVYENMMYPLAMLKIPQQEKEERIAKNAGMLKIDGLLKKKPGQLSGGQKQRVAIGRALVRRPKVFMFDEPLSNLDARLRDELRHQIAALHAELKITTLYVTHDQHEAMSLSDRIVLMDKGNIAQTGTPEEIYNRPANIFCAGFLGYPKINLLPAEYRETGYITQPDLNLSFLPVPENLPADKALHKFTIGVRPETIEILPLGEAGTPAEILMSEFYGNRTHYFAV
ncbi:hypothetical protein CHS0354_006938 [Potamilus streckersoni]|uniref:ABC transporter domain-containing protein n=1 Tax=Potamilus streckersoni TaxID=2493646 RepID=A0AAE0WCW0_9BIVA|nr:hypothetical protein CHS0354_006938 [Potamilus streckersoni]